MGMPLHACEEALDAAVEILFDTDPRIQAVGIARHDSAFGFKAVKNAAGVLPASALKGARKPPRTIKKVPVTVENVTADVEAQVAVPYPLTASFVPEQQSHRPLVLGVQVQNVDDDDRQRQAGQLGVGLMTIGTLGCFVLLGDGTSALLSNNHVLAGENRGRKGQDRVLQPGALTPTAAQTVATLTDFVPLLPSPNNARPARGNVVYNEADAGVAALSAAVGFSRGFLPSRGLPIPNGISTARVGDRVFKVGRTTGLTYGTITAVGTVVGPIAYDAGPCWFRRQFEIVGENGMLFSDHGDSGSVILSTTGEVLGLLYAGNGTQTYACAIQAVLSALNCTLA